MVDKKMIWLGLGVGSTVGALIGLPLDHGNSLGFWSFTLGTVGSFLGIWIAYKISAG